MAGILQRAIAVLDRLYNFPGGTRGLSEFDLDSPITAVHDLSREAEHGARGTQAQGGYLQLGQTLENDTAGAVTILVSTDVYAAFDATGDLNDFRSADHRLWLIGVFGSVDDTNNANWTNSKTTIRYGPGGNNRTQILAVWDLDISSTVAAGDRPMVADEGELPAPVNFPIFFPIGTLWESDSVSTNDCIARIHSLWWAGPIGTTPPGMY